MDKKFEKLAAASSDSSDSGTLKQFGSSQETVLEGSVEVKPDMAPVIGDSSDSGKSEQPAAPQETAAGSSDNIKPVPAGVSPTEQTPLLSRPAEDGDQDIDPAPRSPRRRHPAEASPRRAAPRRGFFDFRNLSRKEKCERVFNYNAIAVFTALVAYGLYTLVKMILDFIHQGN